MSYLRKTVPQDICFVSSYPTEAGDAIVVPDSKLDVGIREDTRLRLSRCAIPRPRVARPVRVALKLDLQAYRARRLQPRLEVSRIDFGAGACFFGRGWNARRREPA